MRKKVDSGRPPLDQLDGGINVTCVALPRDCRVLRLADEHRKRFTLSQTDDQASCESAYS